MVLALAATGIVILALLGEVVLPRIEQAIGHHRARRRRLPQVAEFDVDPGRERRAEARARQLLKSCVNDEDWEMYRDLGFIRVWGTRGRDAARDEPYGYLVYPHKPILAYVPQTGRLLNEYCVEFPDQTRPYGSARLPDSDDVLAKWMALTGDERRLIGSSNMHLPGRQIDPRQVKRDLWRLRQWERARARAADRPGGGGEGPSGDDGGSTRDSRVPMS
ncbi:hypothetical protein VSS74_16115 [Conexibacter stalactiti]|uniref:Uncharacterized protein n=1 Tax=Conexibacter stalactiti TaxID=1940611 RepID=A0ABU4HRK8_9ACTN|nr:hypothetical protein [Conexibacter stalactiti]MDW5595875.1 hypothetical protein [Conexibacter stalactiti]MEC5036517.1 hypothetical protein [Conexibacter stalactiti]